MTRHNKHRAKRLRSLHLWHRYMGLSASLFVILLTVTGLALNHTDELELDSSSVQSGILLDWYGIHAPDIDKSFQAGTHRVTAVGEYIYWDTEKIPGLKAPLIGVIEYADLIVIAVEERLLLFTRAGELIEQLGRAAGVPSGMRAVGLADGNLVIRTVQGYYRTTADFLEWHKDDSLAATWAEGEEPSLQLRQALQASWRGTGLPLERVMLDLHSGRIFGRYGVYLVDAAAVLFLVLAVSGVWLWSRRRASTRQHRRKIRNRTG